MRKLKIFYSSGSGAIPTRFISWRKLYWCRNTRSSKPKRKWTSCASRHNKRKPPSTSPAASWTASLATRTKQSKGPRPNMLSPARGNYPPPQPGYAQPGYGQQQGNYPPAQQGFAPVGGAPGGGSSFLRSAATTAAGVAAGALAFQGVESLMHGFGHAAGFGSGGAFLGGTGMPGEETIVNNYYDSPGDRGSLSNADQFGGSGLDASSGAQGLQDSSFLPQGSDADLNPQLDQADDVNVTGDDTNSMDSGSDSSLDDASYDDSGSSDGGDFGGGDGSDFA